ncbi:MAG: metallophosphoesterase [Prevotellaceae bacterium]|jgi:predicted MPP superfamily phosphohydrolase|nr:metallophosphoesterase [Prevotellaceae bacterium]
MLRYFEFAIIFLIFLGLNVYVISRLYIMMPAILPLRILLIVSAIIVQLPFFVSMFWGNSMPTKITSILYIIGTSWIIIFLYLLLIFLFLDIIRLTHLVNIERFMVHSWYGWGIFSVLISAILIIGNINYYKKNRVEINIETSKPLASQNGLKIVSISDLHLGYGIGKPELENWVRLINAEKPDVVLIAGDVIDNFSKPIFEDKMYKTFRKINTKFGVFMALGNHEYIGNIEENLDFLKRANINVLRDSAVLINDDFYIVGREDYSRKYRKRLAVITDNLDKTKPIICIDHQPMRLKEARQNGVDFQVSGHTHYGQIFPLNYIQKLMFEKPYGYTRKGETQYFITSGLGIWGGKFRIGTRSEYVVINLIGKQSNEQNIK